MCFFTFHGVLCQVWYLIVSFPYLCPLPEVEWVPCLSRKALVFFYNKNKIKYTTVTEKKVIRIDLEKQIRTFIR